MTQYSRGFIFLLTGFVIISLSACATCRVPYKKELTRDSRLEEANTSYKKAIRWIKEGQCAMTAPKSSESYRTADSYLSDTVSKLKQLGHDNNINVDDNVYYCEKVKSEIEVKEGSAREK